jgi:nitronate monooxygenase
MPRLALARADAFCKAYNLHLPILLAPMAGACPPALSAAVANAGGMGACGALLLQPPAIAKWGDEFRARSHGGFQINLWLPDPPPVRNTANEIALRGFLKNFGPEVPSQAADATPPDFTAQFEAALALQPTVISSIMGVFPEHLIERMRAQRIKYFATATTVAEARAAEAAGADAIIAQGAEAGGHRGAFDAAAAERAAVGLFALLPAIAEGAKIPVIAAGAIADARTIAAALLLGASAVQIGTGYLRTPEAAIASAWGEAIHAAQPEHTQLTRAYSGRAGRSLSTLYVRAAAAADAPPPAPYPVQRGLTQAMREAATRENNVDRMQAWCGQAGRLAPAEPAAEITARWWEEAKALLES